MDSDLFLEPASAPATNQPVDPDPKGKIKSLENRIKIMEEQMRVLEAKNKLMESELMFMIQSVEAVTISNYEIRTEKEQLELEFFQKQRDWSNLSLDENEEGRVRFFIEFSHSSRIPIHWLWLL